MSFPSCEVKCSLFLFIHSIYVRTVLNQHFRNVNMSFRSCLVKCCVFAIITIDLRTPLIASSVPLTFDDIDAIAGLGDPAPAGFRSRGLAQGEGEDTAEVVERIDDGFV